MATNNIKSNLTFLIIITAALMQFSCNNKSEKYYLQCPDNNHPHMIDLGLPSGTKWACCNVGASKPEDYGSYYAWGETQTKSEYNWSTYKWCKGSYDTRTKYCTNSDYGTVDNKTTLDNIDDAATANWGAPWKMPSSDQIKELEDNTTSEWMIVNGVYGRKFTGSNGGSIFLPAAGWRRYLALSDVGLSGSYWSSMLYESDFSTANYLYFNLDDTLLCYCLHDRGHSVRPVR